jgi:microcystin-dependent protein
LIIPNTKELIYMEPTLAEIRIFAGNFAPRMWAFCDGQLLPINQNQALFSILGTTYGGDGRTTFGLPDLRGRSAMHAGHGPGLSDRRLGAKGGAETVTLNVTNLASHNHHDTLRANISSADSDNPVGKYPGVSSAVNDGTSDPITVNAYSSTSSVTTPLGHTTNTGGNIPFNIMQPWLAMHYISAMQGIFPSRG